MKKSKLLPKDGSEFTVFFLKEDNADVVVSNNLNEMDVNENSAYGMYVDGHGDAFTAPLPLPLPIPPSPAPASVPINPYVPAPTSVPVPGISMPELGMVSSEELPPVPMHGHQWHPTTLHEVIHNIVPAQLGTVPAQLASSLAPVYHIDDTIDKDVVDSPVIGKIYKVRHLNIVVRCKRIYWAAQPNEPDGFLLSRHGVEFQVSQRDKLLVKASRAEVEEYLGLDK
jgi:hypothetical protein